MADEGNLFFVEPLPESGHQLAYVIV
jgi:hypothetical protein